MSDATTSEQPQVQEKSSAPWEQYSGQRAQEPGPWLRFQQPAGYERKPLELPNDEEMASALTGVLPAVGAGIAGIVAPEAAIPAAIYAALGAGGGSSLEQGIKLAVGAKDTPKNIGEAARKIAGDAATYGAVPELTGSAITKILSKTLGAYFNPERLYQSALMPRGKYPEALRDVKTGLREGIVLGEDTPASIAAIQNRIDALNRGIEGAISSSPAQIPPSQYVRRVQANMDALRRQWGKDPQQAAQFLRQIDDAEKNFLISHGNVKPISYVDPNTGSTVTILPEDMSLAQLRSNANPLSSGDAQQIKKQAWATIRAQNPSAFEVGSHPGLATETREALGQALREELEQIYPDIASQNAREGDLIALRKNIDNYLKREGNRRMLPYFSWVTAGGGLGAMMGGAEGAGMGALGVTAAHLLRGALEDPGVKSRLAIILNQARNTPGMNAVRRVAVEIPANLIRGGEYAASRQSKGGPVRTPDEIRLRSAIGMF